LAFEDGLGNDPSQKREQDYTGSAYDLISRTVSLWARKIMQYIMIVGIIGAACVAVSFMLLLSLFDTIGTLGADPLSYLVTLVFSTMPDIALVFVTLGFAIFAFILNAVINGAAIKFTLDEYGGPGGEVGKSFSHSRGRILNFILVQLILSFFVAIVLTPAIQLLAQAMAMIDITDPLNPIFLPGSLELLTIAFSYMIVGGIFLIYINVRFAPVLAVVIDTDLSPIDSLKRAWGLTSGRFFHVFGSYILLNVAVIILGIAISFGVSVFLLPINYSLVIESIISALLISSLSLIFPVILYRDLNSRLASSSASLDNLRVL